MTRGTLMIVDNERSSREALGSIFIRRGWEVAVFETELEALANLPGYAPDWVIADSEQLRCDGDSFLTDVRDASKRTLVSLFVEDGRCLAAGVTKSTPDLTFVKPVNAEVVFQECEALLAERKSRKEKACGQYQAS
jgi:DNA-binding NtrC family response regulator